jgi:hypothetical protein
MKSTCAVSGAVFCSRGRCLRGGQWWQVSTAGGTAAWRRDGKELYYIAPDGKLMAAPIAVNGTTLEPSAPVALFQTRIWGGGTETYFREQYDVAPMAAFRSTSPPARRPPHRSR